MLSETHQDFLGEFSKVDVHYKREHAPHAWIQSRDTTESQLNDLYDKHYHNPSKESKSILMSVLKNKNVGAGVLEDVADQHPDRDLRLRAAMSPNITYGSFNSAIEDEDLGVADTVAENPHLKPHQIKIALEHEETSVRGNAASNPSIDKEGLSIALMDTESYVRHNAKFNPKYKEYFPNGHEGLI